MVVAALTEAAIRWALAATPSTALSADERAAVAAVLRFDSAGDPWVLLMRRAQRQSDRWSGQVSLPGGREEAGDNTLQATAVRETREELGIDLEQNAELVGALDPVRAVARGRPTNLGIFPFVFFETRATKPVLNQEAERAFWLPLRSAHSGALNHPFSYSNGNQRWQLPSWRFAGETIWGLTHGILTQLLHKISERPHRA